MRPLEHDAREVSSLRSRVLNIRQHLTRAVGTKRRVLDAGRFVQQRELSCSFGALTIRREVGSFFQAAYLPTYPWFPEISARYNDARQISEIWHNSGKIA